MKEKECFHCGDEVIGRGYQLAEKAFCCKGCLSVYQLLNENGMGNFYALETRAGVKPVEENQHKYAFLDVPEIGTKLIDFEDEKTVRVTLFLPEIHCSSCIYLLENCSKINPAILACQVNFSKREAVISFDKAKLTLAQLSLFLSSIGYAPNFGNRNQTAQKLDKIFMYKMGVAGFAFGSIMLWSFPEYLGIEEENETFRNFTAYLSLAVSIPVLLFSARDYFISAWKALRHKRLNLDVPITIGIIALYLQSLYSILNGEGPGYMDSFAGFILFLLIGKWFQSKVYKSMSFERDYTSYFPVAVTRLKNGEETIVEIEQLKIEDTILIRNEEVIPCDSILLSEKAKIDYSFVTGESNPVYKSKGEFIYAGGKLLGQRVALSVRKESNRSHLTQLWNDVKSKKESPGRFVFQDKLSVYFLIIILIIAGLSSIGWLLVDPERVTQIVVAILIVACPCALALSAPFTYGNIMRLLGRKGLYLKNTGVIEQMNQVTDIVFDKTGTLTTGTTLKVDYIGDLLTAEEDEMLYTLANSSTHPLSRAIVGRYRQRSVHSDFSMDEFREISGKGIVAKINGTEVRIGGPDFTGNPLMDPNETSSYFRINDKTGRFIFSSELRPGVGMLMQHLTNYKIHILSGDKDKDKDIMEMILPPGSILKFEQTPKDKLDYIELLKSETRCVLMVGDGLNDSGALGVANVGIAVSEDVFRFTPSSDAIIEASQLASLYYLLQLSGYAKTILIFCLIFSLSYNVIGLSFAISGNLTPLVAAILMPISSITVVFISSMLVFLKNK